MTTGTTWNPSDKGANIVLSNGNLDATNATAAWAAVRATNSHTTGSFYFEVLIATAGTSDADACVGIGKSDFTLTAQLGTTSTSSGYRSAVGWSITGMTTNGDATSSSFRTTNFTVGVAVDLTNGKLWLAIQNSYVQGSPSAGTSPSATFTGSNAYFPACAIFGGNGDKLRIVMSAGLLTYAPPTGFLPWDSAVLTMSATPLSYAFTLSSITGKLAWHMTALPISYALTLVATVMHYGRHITAAPLSFSFTLVNTILVAVVQPASKLKRRIAAFFFSKRRVSAPTLED